MGFFELNSTDITSLGAGDLRELVARLSEAEVIQLGRLSKSVTWGGTQEAPDGGLDVRIEDTGLVSSNGFVPRGVCGFQVKKHTMAGAGCRDEMLEHGALRPVIAELADRNGAYIIVSGKDDCSDSMLTSRLRGMAEAVALLPNKASLHLDFYGRDRLATWLRRHPSVALWVRARLGRPLSGWKPFGRWAATPPGQDDAFLVDDHPCVIDANSSAKDAMPVSKGVKLARDRLRRSGSTVRITGLSGVGKTRFAQALFEAEIGEEALSPASAIYADLGENLSPTASELVSYLISNDHAVHLVLDNCPPDVHRQLQKQISESSARLSLLTIEYDISDDRPEETEVIHLEPCSEKTVSMLAQKRYPNLGQLNANKIAEFSGGNARIAIALASRVEADETLTNFSDEDLFQRLFSQRKGASDQLLGSAEALSLVYSFNVSASEFNDELGILSTIAGLDRRVLHRGQAELLRRHLAQQRGEWRAVLPHALANRLAKRALENIPPDEINAELLKSENRRLFLSCAHRLGYLHDFEPALRLANSWVVPGGPLHDIGSCREESLSALQYIAPVFPQTVLRLIEDAAAGPGFASCENPNFSFFVRLLGQLAYDDDKFDRAVTVMLKFAESETSGENNNGIVSQMRQLFSLHLSGTQAPPSRRRAFVGKLLKSGGQRHREIAGELLHAAFETMHWTSFSMFDFGARRRDSGWRPHTRAEELDWYIGFLNLLRPTLACDDPALREWARSLLAGHFRGLWTLAGCFDELEAIVRNHAAGGSWPKMWIAIKQTIGFDSDAAHPELQARLEALERLAAPSDPYSEIEAYVLASTWDHVESKGELDTVDADTIETKITSLGEVAAAEPSYLERLGPRLWEGKFDALYSFGIGLARGSTNMMATFEYLSHLAQRQAPAVFHPLMLRGYINAVYHMDPGLARRMQERVLDHPLLRPHFIYLLGASEVAPWGIKKLLELARGGEFEPWRFQQLAYGRMHESIPDGELSELLAVLNGWDNGIYTTLDILEMRFFVEKNRNYVPSEELLSVGRRAIRNLLSSEREQIDLSRIRRTKHLVRQCLSASAPEQEIKVIMKLLCDGVDAFRFYSFDLDVIITTLTNNYPEIVLGEVFTGDDRERRLIHHLFKDRLSRSSPSLNSAPVDRLVAWCQGDQDRIARVATAVCAYSATEATDVPLEYPKRVVLSEPIKALLEAAVDKQSIVNTIFSGIQPMSWSGSRADIMEIRARAFAELLEHPLPEVRDLAARKLERVGQVVRQEREREAAEHSRHEQRFE
ncbi:hypothetical protein [Pseudomonas aeruginosa]|uniref:hypothetical protein n=1 Tax=Pseudomonas aeruginosa TaxID=287 RepID=UPI0003D331D1|nr:hypothetical protein [Pseudomonas aeruginosa]ANA68647.1 hypothetical protein A6R75_00325 [Pseudomonas aeruginosa]ETD50677.1 hypothetical protein X778_18790 [Pseudomonas aeruginosa VRFPA07]MBH9357961.1 hypothetical protein [Pseudomonas aeruginosa]MBI7786227.1 hypothetical protein [Pseudomonas aeruginosa]MCD2769618.1 hypothetical protein [Pseudomonas aeruginosa]